MAHCYAFIIGTAALLTASGAASAGISFDENLGNFPDAIQISADFGTFSGLSMNGTSITGTGFHFRLSNTSFTDSSDPAAAFRNDPDGHFADDDVLTSQAATMIGNAQSFGLYSFGAHLPAGSGLVTSAPDGFVVHPHSGEINFKVDLNNPNGLIFDSDVSNISGLFTNPRVGGVWEFFISTPAGFAPSELDISTEFAWAENGQVQTEFFGLDDRDEEELRPRGQLTGQIPSPSVAALFGMFGVFGANRRRRTL